MSPCQNSPVPAPEYEYWILPYRQPQPNSRFAKGANAALCVTYLQGGEIRLLAEFEYPEEARRAKSALEETGIPPLPYRFRRRTTKAPAPPRFVRVPQTEPTDWPSEPTLTQSLREFVKFLARHPELHPQFVQMLEGTGWTMERLFESAGVKSPDSQVAPIPAAPPQPNAPPIVNPPPSAAQTNVNGDDEAPSTR